MIYKSYDPFYDPLTNKTPGKNSEYSPAYWPSTLEKPCEDDGTITTDIETEVAVIGSGFTGLSTALFLARDHSVEVTVLEANKLIWGCTSRNGGQGHHSVGRLIRSQWLKLWGKEKAVKLHNEVDAGFETFKELIAEDGIDCEPQGDGHLYIAHKKDLITKLEHEVDICNKVFNFKSKFLSNDELVEKYVDEKDSFGAYWEPEGIGVNPIKLAVKYADIARKHGAKIHSSSPVENIQEKDGFYYLTTPGGTVKAKKIVIATGGYTSTGLHKRLDYRFMPILSNSIVTRVLTDEELKICGLKSHIIMTDTRILRFYYRLLPDNRLQIGSRSAITGKDATNQKHLDLLINGMYYKFPSLKGIKIDYSWWGWVDISHDMMPRVVQPDSDKEFYYAYGYCGNGVMFASQAGKRMAEKVVGKFDENLKDLPIYDNQLPKHLFTPFRRIGQRIAYKYYYFIDLIS